MKLIVYTIGRLGKAYWREAEKEYLNRLRHYTRLEIKELKDVRARGRSVEEMKHAESQTVLKEIADEAFLVVLDRSGSEMTSVQLAEFIESKQIHRTATLAFAVGGPYGFSDPLFSRADMILSLSRMTLPHELARIVLLEQLYRAFTILKGEKYHK